MGGVGQGSPRGWHPPRRGRGPAMTERHWKEVEPLARLIDPEHWAKLTTYAKRKQFTPAELDEHVEDVISHYPRGPLMQSLEAADRLVEAGYAGPVYVQPC